MSDDYEPKTKFNSSWAKLQRIDKIKQLAHNSRLSSEYSTWYKCLCSWRSEINGKMNQSERIKCDTFEELVVLNLNPKRDYIIATPYYKKHKTTINYTTLIFLIEKYELYLSDIEEKKGIGLVDDDDDDGL